MINWKSVATLPDKAGDYLVLTRHFGVTEVYLAWIDEADEFQVSVYGCTITPDVLYWAYFNLPGA